MQKVAIIGGGVSGLTLAYLLGKTQNEVVVFEKESKLGGLLSTFELNGKRIEKTYHHIFKNDSDILWLIKELKLEEDLVWKESSIGLYWKEKMSSFVTPMDLLKFNGLNLIDKVRLGLIALFLQRDSNWEKYEKITASEWMKTWAGDNAYKVIWRPLLKGKFHDYYKQVSMAWLWARIHIRGLSKDKKGKEYLGYMKGSYGKIIDELETKIKEFGGKINTGVEIIDVKTKVNNEKTKTIKELEKEFDIIVDTRPDSSVDYLGAVNIVFTTNQNLSPYYWHNINDMDSPFLAFIQQTNLMEKSDYKNRHVYYMGAYIPQDHEYFEIDNKIIEKKFYSYLKKIFPKFEVEKIIESKVFKFKYAQHVVDTKYRSRILPYKKTDKIYQMNFSQIYPQDRGINYAVRDARKVFEMVSK